MKLSVAITAIVVMLVLMNKMLTIPSISGSLPDTRRPESPTIMALD